MLPYWILFLAFAAGALPTRLAGPARLATADAAAVQGGGQAVRQRTNPLFIAATVFAALLIGFRYEVGGDWDQYLSIYELLSDYDLWSSLIYNGSDPGYSLINWLSASAGFKIWAVNLACGAIFIYGVARFARCQPNPWLAVVVAVPYLIIGVGMGYTRQAVAIGLAMAGLAALFNGSFRKFMMWTVAAALFHRTAVVMIPIVALSFTRNRLQTIAVGAVGSFMGYYFLLRPALERYSHGYIEQEYEAQGAIIRLAMNLIPAVVFLLFSKRFALDPAQRNIWRNFSFIALAAFGAYFLTQSSVVLDRLALYVIPLQLFVFSRLPAIFGKNGRQSGTILLLILLYSAGVQFVWLNFANHARYWVPYRVYPFFSDEDAAKPRLVS
jgi:hypothetical protein